MSRRSVPAGRPAVIRPASRSPVDRLFEPIDIASIVFFRVAFGAILLWEVWRYFEKGWIARYWIDPPVHFGYFGLEWIRPWPGIGMYLHFAVLGVLALAIMAGFHYRVAALLFFPGLSYVFLLEEAHYLNHVYLMCLVSGIMAVTPAHRAFSVDARRNPAIRSDTVPAWNLWLLRFQFAIPYLFGGLAKLNGDWMRGDPIHAWLMRRSDYPVIGPLLLERETALFFAWGGILLDLLCVPFLLWRRTRALAYLATLFFHLMNDWIFSIGVFAWVMIAATALFFPPDWPRRLLGGVRKAVRRGAPAASPPPAWRKRLTVGALAAWAAFQVLMPLRHFLYPGDVNWTDEGHRFAWHMKLRDKNGEVVFTLTDPVTRESRTVNPREILPDWQLDRVATRPDMILQLSHYLARRYRPPNGELPEVRCASLCSLNGRSPVFLVDPTTDLARVERSLEPAAWIAPHPGGVSLPGPPGAPGVARIPND